MAARFVYLGSEDGPKATRMKWQGSHKHGDLSTTGVYEWEKGGVAIEVPPRMAQRLRSNPFFAEEGSAAAKASFLRRKAIEAAAEAAETARKQTEAEILASGNPTPKPAAKPQPKAQPPAAPVAQAPQPPAAAPVAATQPPQAQMEMRPNASANTGPVAQPGAQTPRGAGGRRKS